MTVEVEYFGQILDEWAESVYRHFCQLHETDRMVPETSMPQVAERTGSDE